jgi:NAD(P)-dependent dehydrogenase (short-subunit alcohol dehydrogenase family)
MNEFKDKVAVITGAASGIGLAMAKRCAHEGMRVVLADIEESTLFVAEEELKAEGADVLAVLVDVSKAEDVERLARKTIDAYGAVHLLCNNAGVGGVSNIWESTLADWKWILGVNLWGVIHGVRTFIPIMLKQDDECHIVNTASLAGLTSYSGTGVYQTSKHAVVSLSENLHHDLTNQEAKIKVSVLCPGLVNTRIIDSERNRPESLQNEGVDEPPSREEKLALQIWERSLSRGISPEQVADDVFQALREGKFYILTHPKQSHMIQTRMDDILQGRDPTDSLAGTPLSMNQDD